MKRMFPSLAAFGVCAAALALGVLLPGWISRGAEKDDLYQRFSMEPVAITAAASDSDGFTHPAAALVSMLRFRSADVDIISPRETAAPGDPLRERLDAFQRRLEAEGWVTGEAVRCFREHYLRLGNSYSQAEWYLRCRYQTQADGEPVPSGMQVSVYFSADGSLLSAEILKADSPDDILSETAGSAERDLYGRDPAETARRFAELVADWNGFTVTEIRPLYADGENTCFRVGFGLGGETSVLQLELEVGSNMLHF